MDFVAFATSHISLRIRIAPRASPLASSEFTEGKEIGSDFSLVYARAVDGAPRMTHVLVVANVEEPAEDIHAKHNANILD